MNEEELLVRQWLESQGYSHICDLSKEKRDPPDFVVEDRIAVEARRLNRGSDSDRGPESIACDLERMLGEVLERAGKTPDGSSVYVRCETQGVSLQTRKDKSKVKQLVAQLVAQYAEQIKNALASNERPQPWKTEWKCGIRLLFYPGRFSNTGRFKLDSVQPDVGSGILVTRDLTANIDRCIREKRDKESIQKKMHCYPEWKWWLVLVDREVMMPPTLNQEERQQIRDNLVDRCPWSRVVVLSNLIQFDVIEQPTQD